MRFLGICVLLAATPLMAQGGPAAGAVPNGADVPGEPLRVDRDAAGGITLTWGPSCSSADTDYSIYRGRLFEFESDTLVRTGFDDHRPLECSVGSGATSYTFAPGPDDAYYLVVPHDGSVEGSYGRRSNGTARGRGPETCRPQSILCGSVPTNSDPIARDDAFTLFEATATTIAILANDLDPDLGPFPLFLTGVTQPMAGSATILPTGEVSYQPAPGFIGDDAFEYTVSDGQASTTARVSVTVVRIRPQPTASVTVVPRSAKVGESVLVSWTSENAVDVTLDGAPVAPSGSFIVRPIMSTTFELVAVGEPGTTPAPADATVTLPECSSPPTPGPVTPCPLWCGSGIVDSLSSVATIVLEPEDLVHVLLLPEGLTEADFDAGTFDDEAQAWFDEFLDIPFYSTFREAFCIWGMPVISSRHIEPGIPADGETAFLVPTKSGDAIDSDALEPDGPTAQKVWEALALFPLPPAEFYPAGGRVSLLAKTLVVALSLYDDEEDNFEFSGVTTRFDNPNDATQRVSVGLGQRRVHEFTHAFGRHRDEYIEDDDTSMGCEDNDDTDSSARVTNVVCDADCEQLPWEHLLFGGTYNPGIEDLVGAYGADVEGFHPEAKCLMNGSHDNADYFGGDGKLRVDYLCNFCRELAAFRLLERTLQLPDNATSWDTWKSERRNVFYQQYPFTIPFPVPQLNSDGEKICPDCPGGDLCPQCGDGLIHGSEVCDVGNFGGLTCADFGFEMGDLACISDCGAISAAGCSGGMSQAPPASYGDCLSDEQMEQCEQVGPGACALLYGQFDCLGGPCRRTDPGDIDFAVSDPFNLVGEFHPDGNFRDEDDNLYWCAEDNGEAVCADVAGWGVCRRCDATDGELNTKLGCSCGEEDDCESFNAGDPPMTCFGEDYGAGLGYCWDDPPPWRCPEGHCGQAPWYENDVMFCQYYAFEARCQPESNCGGPDSLICADDNRICDCDGDCPPDEFSDGTCTVECFEPAHCGEDFGWPPNFCCAGDRCQPC